MPGEKRYRLIRDDDCHWYVIESNQEEMFDKWMEWATYKEGPNPNGDWEPTAVNGYHTLSFVGWKDGE